MRAQRVFESCLYTDDLPAARDFYTRVLGLEVASDFSNRGIAFRCGDGVVIIFDRQQALRHHGDVPGHGTTGAGHLAFAVDSADLPAWRDHFHACGVGIISEVDWDSGGRSIYFLDPAGNILELAPPTLWGFKRSGSGPVTPGHG